MKHLIHAELLKLRTTRMFYGNLLAAIAFVPFSLLIAIQTAGQPGANIPALDTSGGIRNVMSAASAGSFIVLIIGVLIIAGEFRHHTATSTFLVTPDRGRVVKAKLAATTLVGAVLAVAVAALTLAIALPWLAAKHVDVDVLSGDVGFVLLGAMAATALSALVGVGVGCLIRNQTAAVAIALGWTMVVEGLLVSFVPEIGRWLPGGAVAALSGAATVEGGLLPMWGGALLLGAYGLAFAAAGTRFIQRSDIS